MTISYNWLRRYLSFDPKIVTPERVAEILTRTGLEVEGLEQVESVKGGLKGVVVGRVLTCEQHPDADRLRVTTVDIGQGEPLHIVCGAPNVTIGQDVLVATIGTTLYPEGEEKGLKIKKSKIRGQLSEGMICAEDELGLGQSHDGILVLDPGKAVVGQPAADVLNLESEYTLEIGLTPNRTDALGHYGVARDLRAGLMRDGIDTNLSLPSVVAFTPDHKNRPIRVTVEDTDGCPVYLGVTITHVKVKESPDWLKGALKSIGIQPINNVVDVTNFVLHETGHPLHAFDGDKITDDHVIVRTMPAGTKFKTLDGKVRTLDESDLTISNPDGPMCIAGIFGGAESGVTAETQTVFIESAWFDPVRIRKTAKRHGLNTDASFRYERGADPQMTEYALKRAALLITEVSGGRIGSGIAASVNRQFNDRNIDLSYESMYKLLGQEIPRTEVLAILASLDIRVVGENTDFLQVAIPPYRHDVTREADVVEEILRIYGFDNIQFPEGMRMSVPKNMKKQPEDIWRLAAQTMNGAGFTEIMNNSLSKSAYYEDNPDFEGGRTVTILNPLSQDLGVMRRTLLFGGLETILWNANRQRPNVRAFEMGRTYEKTESGYREEQHLAIWITGTFGHGNWTQKPAASSFFTLKGAVENLMTRFNLTAQYRPIQEHPLFTDGLELVVQNKCVGHLGYVAGKYLKTADLDQVVYYAELNCTALTPMIQRARITYEDLPRTFAVERDLALLVDSGVRYADLESAARKAERKLLRDVTLFDVYEGKNLPEGKKSYGMRFTLHDPEKTLTDAQLDAVMKAIQTALEKEFKVELR